MISSQTYLILEWVLFISLLLIGLVSFLKYRSKIKNHFFVLVCISLSLHLLFNISLITGYISKVTILIPLDQINGHLFAIFLLYHIIDVTKVKIKPILLIISSIAGSFVSGYYYIDYLNMSPEQQNVFISNLIQVKPSSVFLIPILFIQLSDIIGIIYFGYIIYLFKKRSDDYLSSNYRKSYQYILLIFIISIGLIVFSVLFILLLPKQFAQFLMIPLVYYLFFFISYLGYSGIPIIEFQQNIDMSDSINKPEINNENNNLKNKIDRVLLDKELYKNPDLSLFDLARELSLSSNSLSNYINSELNTNFSTYINRFRINESKKLLSDCKYDNLTLEAIAELSGFRNRITFYRVFKKIEKSSPSEFKC